MPEPHLRAADADRAAVATELGQAMSEGRLSLAEYDDRLARAYRARTFGELAELTADLPRPDHRARTPDPAAPVPLPGAGCAGPGRHGSTAWGAWAGTAVIVLAVWAITSLVAGELRYFWPFWVIVPWGAVLTLGTLGDRARRTHRRLPG